MKILMIVDWGVEYVQGDVLDEQSANLVVAGVPYWFFKYWPIKELDVDVVGRKPNWIVDFAEKRVLKFNISTAVYMFSLHRYDLVICFHSQAGAIILFLRWLMRMKMPPFVLFDIEGLARKQNQVLVSLFRHIVNNLALIFYFASVQQQDYTKYIPGLMGKTKFLRWGVDFSRYVSDSCGVEDIIVTIGAQGQGFRDWRTLLDAWRIVSNKCQTKLLIVGRESLNIEELGHKLLPERVDFLGRLKLDQMNNIVNKARFVVLSLPERRHSYAQMTLLGCMALGKAVVVSKVSGIIDCVKDGETAIFSETGNAEDMAEKIELLLNNPSFAATVGKKAKEEIEGYYREDQMGKEIYETICSKLNL